jgi:hypothetical protein
VDLHGDLATLHEGVERVLDGAYLHGRLGGDRFYGGPALAGIVACVLGQHEQDKAVCARGR